MLDWLNDFTTWLVDELLTPLAEWLLELVMWVPRTLADLALELLATAYEAIPAPGFLSNTGTLGGISSDVMYFAGMMQIDYGITVIASAYLARFALRRIPFIG